MGQVDQHYAVAGLGERILDALGNPSELTVDDLAPVDAFHIRGRAATEELASWLDLGETDRVLDVGSGLGGTARYLADRHGCRVTGIDLTPDYCDAAALFSERVGLSARTEFYCGSALELPFDDGMFDVAWTEHVQMNIADKAQFYGEIARVLKPGGRFAFHDVFAGKRPEPHYPTPWAGTAEISHLARPDDVDWSGFEKVRWEDRSADALAFFDAALSGPPRPVGLHLLMPDRAREKFENVRRNLAEDRVCVVQAVLVKR